MITLLTFKLATYALKADTLSCLANEYVQHNGKTYVQAYITFSGSEVASSMCVIFFDSLLEKFQLIGYGCKSSLADTVASICK